MMWSRWYYILREKLTGKCRVCDRSDGTHKMSCPVSKQFRWTGPAKMMWK